MDVTVKEKPESPRVTRGDDASVELLCRVRGTSGFLAAGDALRAWAPDTYEDPDTGEDLLLKNFTVEAAFIDETNADACLWDGTVKYVKEEKKTPESGESSFSFDTGGGSQHVTQSLDTIAERGPGEAFTIPNFCGAIGVTRDNVEGVDITTPVMYFQETHQLPAAYVTETYKNILYNLTGKVNRHRFKGKPPGDVLFIRACGSQRGAGPWELTFHFSAKPWRSNVHIPTSDSPADDIVFERIEGWQYLWVWYNDVEDSASKMLIKRPAAAYVEKLYEYGDFSLIGIGVT